MEGMRPRSSINHIHTMRPRQWSILAAARGRVIAGAAPELAGVTVVGTADIEAARGRAPR